MAAAAAGLRRLGVAKGDRVAAYLPNVPETVVAMLATASIGAIWSSCAPEFGVSSVVDRFGELADAGAQHVIFSLAEVHDTRHIETIGREIVPQVRAL